MVLIEDIVAIENLDDILDVDHIDVFYVAPVDLAASMGHIGDVEHADVQEAVDRAIERIQQKGRVAGTLANNQNVAKYVDAGVRFLFTMAGRWIADGARDFMQRSQAATDSQ